MVRSHFDILFQTVQNNNGRAIKTIGDAVMGIFFCEFEAFKAAVEVQDALKQAKLATAILIRFR
jgi:class 3 adenylate cyclase